MYHLRRMFESGSLHGYYTSWKKDSMLVYPKSRVFCLFLVSFWVPQHLHAGILGLALCVAFELEEGIEASLSCEVWVLGNRIWSNYSTGTFSLVLSDHLWLNYFPCCSFDELDEMLETERSLFQVSFEVSEATLRRCLGFALYASEQRMTKVLFANMNCP